MNKNYEELISDWHLIITKFGLTKKEIFERLKRRSKISGECWIWMGATSPHGHGVATINNITCIPSRISLVLFADLDYDNKFIKALHKNDICSSPRCWNPDHLYSGTESQNSMDALEAGRRIHRFNDGTHCKYGHELVKDNIYRERGYIRCRLCRKNRARKYRRRII